MFFMSEEQKKERKSILDSVLKNIEKQFGKGSIMRMGELGHVPVESISTGSLSVDIAIGIGGLPKGRIIEIFGPESSGKTTLSLSCIASCQRGGGTCAFIDAEHALDPIYAKKLGVDIQNLIISQPDNGEQALEIVDSLANSGSVDMIIVDSVAALVPKKEIDGDMGDNHLGTQARLMSQALRKLSVAASRSNCIIIFINQIRMKIGVMFGSPETTTGGNALKFFSSVRIDIRRVETIKKGEVAIGNKTKVKIVKNKVSSPFTIAEFDIIFGEGINKTGEIVTMASKLGIIEKSGSWYSYKGERISQGIDNCKEYLKSNPKIATELEAEIKSKISEKPEIILTASSEDSEISEKDEESKD